MLVEVSHLDDAQIDALFQMYQFEWWSRGRKRDDVREIVKHSAEIITLWDSETKQLVAFARVLTDYVYRGLILNYQNREKFESCDRQLPNKLLGLLTRVYAAMMACRRSPLKMPKLPASFP